MSNRSNRALIALALLASVIVAPTGAAAAAADVPRSAEAPRGFMPLPLPDPAQGIVVNDLIPGDPACRGLLRVKTDTPGARCTKGPDPTASFASQRALAAAATGDDAGAGATFECHGDGEAGYRVETIYVHGKSDESQYATRLPDIVQKLANVQERFRKASLYFGGSVELEPRFVHTPAAGPVCAPIIHELQIGDGALRTFGATMTAVEKAGFDQPRRLYLLLVEDDSYCGIATVNTDEEPDPLHNEGSFADYGRSWAHYARADLQGCNEDWVMTHEVLHSLGAAHPAAPYATNGWHCYDEWDLLCYDDGALPSGKAVIERAGCDAATAEDRGAIDCGGDTYFHPDPAPGSYLASSWNVASSSFLFHAGQPAPVAVSPAAPTVSSPVNGESLLAIDDGEELTPYRHVNVIGAVDAAADVMVRVTAGGVLTTESPAADGSFSSEVYLDGVGEHTITVETITAHGYTSSAVDRTVELRPPAPKMFEVSPVNGSSLEGDPDGTTRVVVSGRVQDYDVATSLTVERAGHAAVSPTLGANGTWSTSMQVAPGPINLTLRMENANGDSTTDSTAFEVLAPAPSVAIEQPSAKSVRLDRGTSTSQVTVRGTADLHGATGTFAVSSSSFTTKRGTVSGGTWATSAPLSIGQHTITVEVRNSQGRAATKQVTLTVTTPLPPTLHVTNPTTTTDNDGLVWVSGTTDGATSVTVTSSRDGLSSLPVSGSGSFGRTLTLTDGAHRLTFVARDDHGQLTTVTREITVTRPVPDIDRFSDDDDSMFEADIEWLAHRGITKGCNPPDNTLFCPEDVVTRGQMAAFLARALQLPAATERFVDVQAGDTFAVPIGALANAGITRGCNPPTNTRFCPDDPVTREQMAAFITRALSLPAGSRSFVDVPGADVFAKPISALATAGITRGCNPPANTRFCPKDPVTREVMAAFLHRALG